MSNGRSSKLWIVNIISFILFIILFSSGLLNWLVLPRGYEARGSFSVSLRHFFIALHEWAALIFIVVIAVHIVLHWPYIKSNLKKYGMITKGTMIINGKKKYENLSNNVIEKAIGEASAGGAEMSPGVTTRISLARTLA